MTRERVYKIYSGLKNRCENPNNYSYPNYGYKGIKCEWATFEDFYADMGLAYKRHAGRYGEKNTTIDRRDPKGNYSLDNCRWATYAEQNRNYSQNNYIEFNGRKQCLSDWAAELGIKRTTLTTRLHRYGWPIERAFSRDS